MDERRKERRILATCLAYELDGNFLGVSLDLSLEGIRLIVPHNFPHFDSFSIQLQPFENHNFPPIILRLRPRWRQKRNRAYDEIGSQIIPVELESKWRELVKWYVENQEQKAPNHFFTLVSSDRKQ